MTEQCVGCQHWDLRKSDLRSIGYGKCKVDPERNELLRAGRHLSPTNVCRVGLFKPAPDATVERRHKELSR